MSRKVRLHDSYVKQLFIGCEGEKDCKNFFCKSEISKSALYKIADILSHYGRMFLCNHDISKSLIKLDPKRNRNFILDFYLYIVFPNLHVFEPGDLLREHKYCEFFKQKSFSDEDQILIEGILALLLKKYIDSDNINLSHVIIRIFCEILLKVDLKHRIFLNLSDVFLNIDKLCRELKYKTPDKQQVKLRAQMSYCSTFKHGQVAVNLLERPKQNPCSNGITQPSEQEGDVHTKTEQTKPIIPISECENCLFRNLFTEYDLKNLITRFREFFNTKERENLRTSKRVEELLNIFHILFCINEKVGITSFKNFYLDDFCFFQNFKEEIRLNKSCYKTLLRYPFILPISLKSEYIKSENNDLMKTKLQDAFFKALFIGETSPYFFISVNRNSLYSDMFRLLMNADDDDILKEIKITFEGEEGVDSGGITKEFFQLISDDLVQDNFLFKIKNNVLWFNEEIYTKKYEIVGKLVGVALYNDVILNIPFPTFLFKIFLNKKPNLEDLSEIEPEIYNSLKKMLNFNTEELENLEQPFSISRKGKSIDLIPNGKFINVNIHNRETFTSKYSEYIMMKEMKMNIDGLKKGFLSVIRMNIISFLQPSELEKIIVGCSTINIKTLRKSAIYSGFSPDFWLIESFWKIFEDYSLDDQKKLLMFITGNERVPVGNNENSKLIIVKNGCDTDRLPSSQTCFNTLLLPEYSSKEKLQKKLGQAISMTKGFFLL